MMDIKPVAWVPLFEIERGKSPSTWNLQDLRGQHDVPLYDQSAIDTMLAEIYALRSGMTPRGDDMIVPMALLDEINEVSAGYMADAIRYRWLCDGNGYFMEENFLCGHENEKDLADAAIDKAMRDKNT